MIKMEEVDNIRKVQDAYSKELDKNLSRRQIVKKISKKLKLDRELVYTYLDINLQILLDTT